MAAYNADPYVNPNNYQNPPYIQQNQPPVQAQYPAPNRLFGNQQVVAPIPNLPQQQQIYGNNHLPMYNFGFVFSSYCL